MKAKIGIYKHDPRANNMKGQSRLVKTIETKTDLKDMCRTPSWKAIVSELVKAELGAETEVLAVSVVHGSGDLDVNIAVTIDNKPPRFGQRRKPVTRGGKPMGSGPVKTGKTMAAKRRNDGR